MLFVFVRKLFYFNPDQNLKIYSEEQNQELDNTKETNNNLKNSMKGIYNNCNC